MIEIRLKEMLERRGRSLYWLAQETDIHYPNLWKLAEGDVSRVTLAALDRICGALRCPVGGILVRIEDERKRGRK